MTADRRAATLRATKCVMCVLYISQIFILSSNDLSEHLKKCAKVCIFRYDGLLSANSLVLEVSLYREIVVDQRLFPVMRKSELAEEKVWKRDIANKRAEYDRLIRVFFLRNIYNNKPVVHVCRE